MARAPYILARNFREAHTFARETLELQRGHYRIVTAPGTLKAARGVDLHLVPGWENRFDRFSLRGALRYTRMNVIDHAAQAEVPAEPVVDAPATEQEVASFFAEVIDLTKPVDLVKDPDFVLNDKGEAVHADEIDPASERAEEPATEKPKRRRRRCDDCGILVDPDEVEAHAREHLEGN